MTENRTEEFVAKVDAFAASLEAEEQVMLVELLVGDDEVSGFEYTAVTFEGGFKWPGLRSLIGDFDATAARSAKTSADN